MMDIETRRAEIKAYYDQRATTDNYATSPDFNLREVEIEYITRQLHDGEEILDIGCGNGYSTARFASQVNSRFIGVDFSEKMIASAKELITRFDLIGEINFESGDVTQLRFEKETFDTVLTQRLLINLPTPDIQETALREIARVLKPKGRYLMIEQSMQGWENLNRMREQFGLAPIPAAHPVTNWFNIKFEEQRLTDMLSPWFDIVDTQRFGMYFFISRVLHPLLVAPEEPRYDAKINEIAYRVACQIPNYEDLGHMIFLILQKK